MIDIGSMYSRIEADTSQLKKAESDIASFAGKAAGLFAGIFTISKAAEFTKTVAFATARFETMGVVMNNVGKNAGYSASQMESYELALRKTGISMTSTRETLTKLAQANIDLAQSQDLARIAQDAAVIGNINSSEAFERMIRGIQAGEVEILRNIGINVSFQKSYEDLAAKLKISTKELTEQEKTQARANAVLAEGAKIFGTYEAAMETPMKKFLSLQRYVEDTSVLLGKLFQPAFGTMVDAATKSLKDFQKELNPANLKEWGEDLNNITKTAGALIDDYGKNLVILAGILTAAKVAQYGLNTAIKAAPYMIAFAAIDHFIDKVDEYKTKTLNAATVTDTFAQSLRGLAAVAKGEISFMDYAMSNEAELKKLLSDNAGTAEINKSLDQMKDKLKEVRESWAFTAEVRKSKEEAISLIKEQITALEAQKDAVKNVFVTAADESLLEDSLKKVQERIGAGNIKKPDENNGRATNVDTGLGRDMNALARAQLDYQESIQEKKLALTQQGIEKELLLNEQGYELGEKSYQEYFDTRQAKTEELLKMELSAREEQLANAKQAAENISDIIDKDGAVDAEKTSKVKINALKEVEEAQKDVYEAQSKLSQAEIEGAHESKLANLERSQSYKAIQVQLLEMQGSAVEAAKLQAEIDEQSIERKKLIAEAARGNAEAEKALAAQRLMSENSIKIAEIDSISRKQEALLAIAEIDGEHQKSREIQIQLLDIEIARAELNGKKKEEIDLLRRQRQELERMLNPLTALAKGWEDVVKASTDANKMIYEFGRNTAQNTFDAFSDILFDGMDTGFKNLGDIAEDAWEMIYKSFLRLLADMATAWAASEIFEMFTGKESGFSFSGFFGGASGSSAGGSGGNAIAGIGGELVKQKVSDYVSSTVASYFSSNAGASAAAINSTNLAQGTATPAILDAAANSTGNAGSLLSTAGGAIGVGAGMYGMYSGLGNMADGNYAVGGVQTALGGYSTYQGAVTLGLIEEGAATAAYDAITTTLSSYFSGAATTGATVAAPVATTAAPVAEGAGMFSGAAASTGPAAIFAMIAAWAAMDIADSGRNKTRDKLNESRITPAGFGMIGGIETDGQLKRTSEEMRDALGLLNNAFTEVDAASIDTASGVMVLANNIVGENGLITGVQYGIETFDNASGVWTRSQVSFSDLIDKMEAHIDVTGDSVAATAEWVATAEGVPTVADELAAAFIEMQKGIFGVAGAAVSGAGTFASAVAMMQGAASGINWSGGNNVPWEDQSNSSVKYSQAWVASGGGGQQSSDQGYSSSYQDQDSFGMAEGGVVNKLLVPSADDGFAALSFGEGIIDRSTMEVLSSAIKDGSFGKSQPIIINLTNQLGNEVLDRYVIRLADGHAATRQQKNIQGKMYA